MAYLDMHPDYRPLLARQGLRTAGDFLALPGVVCCGHPDRNVARVTLGSGPEAIHAILKREHRIRWRDRLASAGAGFGLVSKSRREFALLQALQTTDIGCPQAIAAGEDDDGRAFLLVRELQDCQDLRHALEQMAGATPGNRRTLACQLGAAVARMHQAGFEHGDLYSKHILVNQEQPTFCILDWQRARKRQRVGWASRWRDLATLDATLADGLANPRDRLRALHAYLKACVTPNERRAGLGLSTAAHEIRRRSLRLLQRRRIREMRQPPLTLGTQNLIWLDGEALQVTREFHDELAGQIPPWLKKVSGAFSVSPVLLPSARLAQLATRWASRPWRWLWSCLRRQPLVAPELESMKVLFRLERYGVVMPRLLAAGQKHHKPWQTESFLLTEPLQGAVPLPEFLEAAQPAVRRQVLGMAARVMRQMHQATCYLERDRRQAIGKLVTVCSAKGAEPKVALGTVHGIEKSHYPNPMRARRDLAALALALAGTCSQTDLLRGLLAYTDRPRLTRGSRQFARRLLLELTALQPQRRVAA